MDRHDEEISASAAGWRLRWLIARSGLKDAAIAEKAKVHPGTFKHWRDGERLPDYASAKKLEPVLDCTAKFVVEGGSWVKDGVPAPVRPVTPDREATIVELVERYPKRWSVGDVARAMEANHRRGAPEAGWKAWLDQIQAQSKASAKKKPSEKSDGVMLAKKIERRKPE
jgi:transcriptional regulator with XRE-family HTH domain